MDNDEKNHDANTNRFCIMFLNFTPCLFRWKNMIYYFVMCILSKRDICWKIKEIFSMLVLESLYFQAHRILQSWILTEIKCHSTTIYFVLLVVFLGKQVELFKLWRTKLQHFKIVLLCCMCSRRNTKLESRYLFLAGFSYCKIIKTRKVVVWVWIFFSV